MPAASSAQATPDRGMTHSRIASRSAMTAMKAKKRYRASSTCKRQLVKQAGEVLARRQSVVPCSTCSSTCGEPAGVWSQAAALAPLAGRSTSTAALGMHLKATVHGPVLGRRVATALLLCHLQCHVGSGPPALSLLRQMASQQDETSIHVSAPSVSLNGQRRLSANRLAQQWRDGTLAESLRE